MRRYALIALGVVTVLASGVIVWTAATTSDANEPLPPRASGAEAEQTYTNEFIDFQFTYPAGYRVLKATERSASIGDVAGYVVITVDVEESTRSLEEWRQTLPQENTSIEASELGGVPAFHIVRQEYDSGPEHELATIRQMKLIRVHYRGLTDVESRQLRESFRFTGAAD